MWLSRFVVTALLFIPVTSQAQLEESYKHDEPYYLFPIKPGERNTLAGTMGELRSSHFHTGLDIRTEGRTGLPVMASAEGYISRVAVSTTGYGNALYITHPNGHTTVYAHLDKFSGPIAEYVKKEQYRRQSVSVNLYFHKDRFKVKKGEVIALSGNSGSSGGPHLHYDIRDKNNKPINPLYYGFSEILDRTPPVAQQLAIKTLDKYSRVNDQFGLSTFDVRRVGNDYVIDKPINVYGNIGLELYAYDKLDNSRFRCGIVTIAVEVDGELLFEQTIDELSFSKQRNILAHMNYSQLVNTGRRYHKLYVDDGNELDFYKATNKGILNLSSDCEKQVKITMIDSYKNKSHLNFTLTCKTPDYKLSASEPIVKNATLIDNTLVIPTPIADGENTIELYIPESTTLSPAYITNDMAVYLWDMNKGLPHSARAANTTELFNYQNTVSPVSDYNFYSEYIDITFPRASLFDTLYMQTDYHYDSTLNKEIFSIGNQITPLKKHIKVTLKPKKDYDDKYAVYSVNNGNYNYQGGAYSDQKFTFYTRDFGNYTFIKDTIPPQTTVIKTNINDLVFKIQDDLSGIKSYKCSIDDQWVLMHYDYKRNLIWSEKYDDEKYSGKVKLVVTDNAGNKSETIINL